MKRLTLARLRKLGFQMTLHINGGSDSSTIVKQNKEWELAIETNTDGSPDYHIVSRVLWRVNGQAQLDMTKGSTEKNLRAFIKAYNADSRRLASATPRDIAASL